MHHDHHDHHGAAPAWQAFEITSAVVLLTAAAAYLAAAWTVRRARPWPIWRSALWLSGLACVAAGLIGPLAAAAHGSFTAHMAGHLLIGMLGPLLLVLAAPVSLALRALPTAGARAVTTALRSPPVRVIAHPAVAAVLNAGGLWLLYTTDLYALMHTSVWLHALVHAHIVIVGVVFTAAIIGPDPNPHRANFRLRAGVLVAFIAVHSILGKWLYAYPPAGVEAADARAGAQLMYYGGDVVDVILLVLLFAGWYSSRGRAALFQPNASAGHPRPTFQQENPV